MSFQRVKDILDQGMAAWVAQHGAPDLRAHGPKFSWATREALLEAVGHGKRLIPPNMIGNNMGSQTNLVIDLRTGIASPADRMPKGVLYTGPPD